MGFFSLPLAPTVQVRSAKCSPRWGFTPKKRPSIPLTQRMRLLKRRRGSQKGLTGNSHSISATRTSRGPARWVADAVPQTGLDRPGRQVRRSWRAEPSQRFEAERGGRRSTELSPLPAVICLHEQRTKRRAGDGGKGTAA